MRLSPDLLSSTISLAHAYDEAGRAADALRLREDTLARMQTMVRTQGRAAVPIAEESDLRKAMAHG